jgi:hypothetical protein
MMAETASRPPMVAGALTMVRIRCADALATPAPYCDVAPTQAAVQLHPQLS